MTLKIILNGLICSNGLKGKGMPGNMVVLKVDIMGNIYQHPALVKGGCDG
jgi:hypothetical protein